MLLGFAISTTVLWAVYVVSSTEVVRRRSKHSKRFQSVLDALDTDDSRNFGSIAQLRGHSRSLDSSRVHAVASTDKERFKWSQTSEIGSANRNKSAPLNGANKASYENSEAVADGHTIQGHKQDSQVQASQTEEDIEESAVKEVLNEWKPREGHDAEEEQRFRKFRPGERVDVVKGKFGNFHENKNSIFDQNVELVRGVRPSKQGVYAFMSTKRPATFICLNGEGGQRPVSAVNDDFCDCSDGSDEPGTSACSTGYTDDKSAAGSFYCGWDQKSESGAQDAGLDDTLFSSQVNDGVCDCCNGADEYLHLGGIVCEDRCNTIVSNRNADRLLFEEGKILRKTQYAYKTRDHITFGPEGAFFPLSKKCFKFPFGEYVYDICPFKSMKQTERVRGRSVKLGSGKGVWENPHLLVMSGGTYCPNHGPRKAKIEMKCGLKDVIVAVEEFETCVYRVVMTTPAACF